MADVDPNINRLTSVPVTPALPTFSQWLPAITAWREGDGDAMKTHMFGTDNAKITTRNAIKDLELWYQNPQQRAGTALATLSEPQEALFQNAMQFTLTIADSMQAPWAGVFSAWAKEHADDIKALLEKHNGPDARLNSHYLRADLMEAVGKAVEGESKLFRSEKNNALLTKNNAGEFEVVDEKKIIDLAQGGVHIITTGTHAFFEKEGDLTAVTDAFGRIATAALGDAAPRLKTIDADPQPGDTVLVAMTNTRENNFLNLASLFRRVGDAREHINKPEKDDFSHLLPMAQHTARLLLKSIVTNPEAIQELPYDASGTMQAVNQTDHQGGAPLLFNQRIELLPDAPKILRHYLLHTFSMGGNAQRDGALRFLVHQLDAKAADGTSLVTFPEKMEIRDVISGISQIATGLNEENIADYYIQRGAEGHLVSNKEDTIVAPSSGPHRAEDARFDYDGLAKYDGHAPIIMQRGVESDPYLLDQYRCAYAAAAGKTAITHVEVNAEKNGLLLQVAPGTTDDLFKGATSALTDALAAQGLAVTVEETGGYGRTRFVLRGDHLLSHDSLVKIHAAFTALQADAQAPLVISQVVTEQELIPHIGHTRMAEDTRFMPRNWLTERLQNPGAIVQNATAARRGLNHGKGPPESYADVIAQQGPSSHSLS